MLLRLASRYCPSSRICKVVKGSEAARQSVAAERRRVLDVEKEVAMVQVQYSDEVYKAMSCVSLVSLWYNNVGAVRAIREERIANILPKLFFLQCNGYFYGGDVDLHGEKRS